MRQHKINIDALDIIQKNIQFIALDNNEILLGLHAYEI